MLDFPRHQNAGDSLIWRGSRDYLDQLGVNVRYVCSLAHFSAEELRRRVPAGPIVLHGGGNLGDLWPEQQAFRERVVAEFPDRQIIQFPQSMNFSDPVNAARCRAVFSKHPDLTILIREHAQLEQAREYFPENKVEFCYDLAVGIGMIPRPAPAVVDISFLLREDRESRGQTLPPMDGITYESRDWGLDGTLGLVKHRAGRFAEDVSRVIPAAYRVLAPVVQRSFELYADANISSASRILSRGRVVITDRLHAMVQASLLGIPVVASDNSNGKVRSLYGDYIGELPGVHFADTPAAAVATARGLLR